KLRLVGIENGAADIAAEVEVRPRQHTRGTAVGWRDYRLRLLVVGQDCGQPARSRQPAEQRRRGDDRRSGKNRSRSHGVVSSRWCASHVRNRAAVSPREGDRRTTVVRNAVKPGRAPWRGLLRRLALGATPLDLVSVGGA